MPEQQLTDFFNYNDTHLPIRQDLIDTSRESWDAMRRPGTWWTGEQRVAIVKETRNAVDSPLCKERKATLMFAGMSSLPDADQKSMELLGGPTVEFIHRLTTDSARLSEKDFRALTQDTISEEQYVEIVGLVSLVVSIDDFHRGIGVPLEPLPEPIAGEPSRYKLDDARLETDTGWVRMLKPTEAKGNESDLWSGSAHAPNVMRAVTLVPNALREYHRQSEAQYLGIKDAMNFGDSIEYRSLSRLQIELVASRVAAINECYYCTSGHSMMLDAAAKKTGVDLDLQAVNGKAANGTGAPLGDELAAFAEGIARRDAEATAKARVELEKASSGEAVIDAAAVAGNFMRMALIADGCGVSMDKPLQVMAQTVQARLDLDRFGSANNTRQLPWFLKGIGPAVRWIGMRIAPLIIKPQDTKHQ